MVERGIEIDQEVEVLIHGEIEGGMDEGLQGGVDFGVKLRRGNGRDKRDMVREVD